MHLKITLKRRINNAVLTIYLPTALILIIVYATNFFKDYFFEAVVTVNLTSLLVLTTLFISVSQSLPPTAYVKMVDIWLIFAQLVPFAEVLLHTWMDSLRVSEDREVNHHGTSVKVGETQNTEEKVFKFNVVNKKVKNCFGSYFIQKTYTQNDFFVYIYFKFSWELLLCMLSIFLLLQSDMSRL